MSCKAKTAGIPGGLARISNEADRPRQGCAAREDFIIVALNHMYRLKGHPPFGGCPEFFELKTSP